MDNFENSTDKELLQLSSDQPQQRIIAVLFKRHVQLVLGLSYSYLKNQHLAEDAAMDIFESLMNKVDIGQIQQFKPWLLTVTRNHCLKLLNRQLKKDRELFDKNIPIESVEYYEDVDPLLEQQLQHLENTLDELNEHQQICISLFYLKGHSYAQVAELSGYSLKEVKSHIQNGKRTLKIKLNQQAT